MTKLAPDASLAGALLRSMVRIRIAEETIAARYPEGKMRCPTHLSIGQEAVSAAAGLALRHSDLAVSTHRAHGHYLGKGGNLRAMIAEIYGRRSGCARGKGGSMHLIDRSVGFMGSTAIVGNTVPVGVGLALSIQLHRTDQVSCVFLGDAVVEEGVFFESVNFAVLRKLPVLFVCENNLYSVYSPLRVRQPRGRSISDMVAGLGIATHTADGNDALAVHELTSEAIRTMRRSAQPIFLEFSTYRWREHCGPNFDNDLGYRTEAEFLEWKAQDPIPRLLSVLGGAGVDAAALMHSVEREVRDEVTEAFTFAENAPFPSAEELFDDVYTPAAAACVGG